VEESGAALRKDVLAAIAAAVPGCDVARLAPDRPLREQVELDSLDWLNLIDGLGEPGLVDGGACEPGRMASVDALVAWLASAKAARRAGSPPSPDTHRLADGTLVRLRPLGARDQALEAWFVANLSAESRYQRFMVTVRELPQRKLRELTDVDGVRHVALVATTLRDAQEVPLGIARYIVDEAGTGCEFAITVADECRDSGLAGLLMSRLIGTARARGLARMEGDVLAGNRAMLRFARQLGFEREAVVRVARAL
jgi:GNAT superfamily N-acetyltransferase